MSCLKLADFDWLSLHDEAVDCRWPMAIFGRILSLLLLLLRPSVLAQLESVAMRAIFGSMAQIMLYCALGANSTGASGRCSNLCNSLGLNSSSSLCMVADFGWEFSPVIAKLGKRTHSHDEALAGYFSGHYVTHSKFSKHTTYPLALASTLPAAATAVVATTLANIWGTLGPIAIDYGNHRKRRTTQQNTT